MVIVLLELFYLPSIYVPFLAFTYNHYLIRSKYNIVK